mmetsp:Transcript_109861/g.342428  ORF Transcript_109861/g.342428 Transcript_109861/m.342428 type:complete len:488 (+) Transcript_109861:81-1544(+)
MAAFALRNPLALPLLLHAVLPPAAGNASTCREPERGSMLLQKRVRIEALGFSVAQNASLLAQIPFRAGVMHRVDALQDLALMQSIARLGFPLSQPENAVEAAETPWTRPGARPLAACPAGEDDGRHLALSEADGNLHQALATFCKAGLGPLTEFFVDERFAAAAARLRATDGWLPQAFVSFVGLTLSNGARIGAEMDLLIQSVHHFSEKPIVVVNFGSLVPTTWTPDRFPRLILMHARDAKALTGKSFNFNKLTAMMFTKVKTGIALDADQWVNHGLDYLFGRAEEETTKDYPYPIMPVHWMSRDPESNDMRGYPDSYTFHFASSGGPRRSMRWGHAHPTWAHHALPWLAIWTARVLAPAKTGAPRWLQEQGWVEDEDLLNMALWDANATKQWCKYDTPSPGDFRLYLSQQVQERTKVMPDSKWFPNGIAYIFFTAHDAKKPRESYQLLRQLWSLDDDSRRAVYYGGHWFGSGKALQRFDPALKCMA